MKSACFVNSVFNAAETALTLRIRLIENKADKTYLPLCVCTTLLTELKQLQPQETLVASWFLFNYKTLLKAQPGPTDRAKYALHSLHPHALQFANHEKER